MALNDNAARTITTHIEREAVPAELLALLDMLGARLQFERSAVRLYDALIAKRDAYGGYRGGPTCDDLQQIRNDELAHTQLLDELISDLGGDSTAVTPSARREAITTRGLAEVLLDPRTSVLDGLQAVIVAELADREQWNGLIEAVRELGREDLVPRFQRAQTMEEEHLSKIRRWISAGRLASMGSTRAQVERR